MIKETDLDIVIAELRLELERIDRAIMVFEKLALQKKAVRRKPSRAASFRLKRSASSPSIQPPAQA